MGDKMKSEEYYEKCRALMSAMKHEIDLTNADLATLLWILEEEFERLGTTIGIYLTK